MASSVKSGSCMCYLCASEYDLCTPLSHSILSNIFNTNIIILRGAAIKLNRSRITIKDVVPHPCTDTAKSASSLTNLPRRNLIDWDHRVSIANGYCVKGIMWESIKAATFEPRRFHRDKSAQIGRVGIWHFRALLVTILI